AEALASKLSQRLRGFGPGDGALIVGHAPAGALHRDREVLVLGESFFGIATDLLDGLLAPGADRAGHNRHCAEARKRTTFEVLRRYIFQRLPFGHDVDTVADLGVAGHRGEAFVTGEPARKARNR